ncbi:response regulator [Ramlibacter sp. PS3R-8]|uniref:response regulator transcription factor n=1 Tax=Ramlibacter sp. PS3R-8 TaxID=3133437 RepID=UPI0030B31B33
MNNTHQFEFRSPQPVSLRATEAELPTVHVVDDDLHVRVALARLLGATGCYQVQAHSCAEDFLAAYNPDVNACLVLDVALPGLDGVGLAHRLQEGAHAVSIVFLSGCADVPMCADAMRRGAVDFLTKPVDAELLFSAVARAIEQDATLRALQVQQDLATARMATLTPREKEVLAHVAQGRMNKQIAGYLGTAEKTVKVHRARVMEKMRVRSVAELVRLMERGRVGSELR